MRTDNDLLTAQLKQLPETLQEKLRKQLQNFSVQGLSSSQVRESLCKVWACSDFVAQTCLGTPDLLQDLDSSGDLLNCYESDTYSRKLAGELETVIREEDLFKVLRSLRQREMVRIAWRDIAGWAPLEEVMGDLSALADACIEAAMDFLYQQQLGESGQPGSVSSPVRMTVIAMGKLGARELNFSSDVDLIFCYPESGETDKGRSHEDFFARLGRKLIQCLDQLTPQGFVFRVDMRLRPFGDSGALASSFDALEHYYQTHGRDWERYAMVKARAIGEQAEQVEKLLTPFVYRRYLDFEAYHALRDMKQRISVEMKRKGMSDNVKLGPGGIREIEFIAQAFQLIRGGRDAQLQERQILKVLPMLAEKSLLPDYVVQELMSSYRFLRTVEHRLQQVADQQTHQLPGGDVERIRLAYSLGFDGWDPFIKQLDRHRNRVHSHFDQVFEAPQVEHAQTEQGGFSDVWLGLLDDESACQVLHNGGFIETQQVLEDLQSVSSSSRLRAMSQSGRKRMDQLMPLIIGAVAMVPEPHLVLKRVLGLIEAVARRTSYLALLVENPMALSQLVKLCSVSPWINAQLSRQPILLDELLDPRTLYTPPGREQLERDLAQRMSGVDQDDLERQMDVLRHFKNANVLRVAAADISGSVPLMVVSDHLTMIAELVLNKILELAWAYMCHRHGKPDNTEEDVTRSGFCVVAYGKLGGIELGYGSDLDLVFLYIGSQNNLTNGSKPLSNAVFYSRLGQRVIHLLTTLTPAGVLYEVDMRLRPSGASGLLVTPLESFQEYQKNKAWTWERQALVRARVVAGDPAVAKCFKEIRDESLSRNTELIDLKKEVREMRERMRKQHLDTKNSEFDLKQGHGGIADIEFMVQYAVLAHAHERPGLIRYSDNVRILAQMCECGVISASNAELLTEAYKIMRSEIHRCTLRELPASTTNADITQMSVKVKEIWQQTML